MLVVAIERFQPKHPYNLSERVRTTAVWTDDKKTQVAINWPPFHGTWLSMQPDGTWLPKNDIAGSYEIANVLDSGFEYNPGWPSRTPTGENGPFVDMSIVVSGRVLDDDGQ